MSLFSLRKTAPDADDDSAAGRVARAEAALTNGDLATAVTELQGLNGAATGWLADAEARLAADSVIDQLTTRAIATLESDGG